MKENLINAVQSRPALWDKWNKNHHNRRYLDKEWKAIAAELQSTGKLKPIFSNLSFWKFCYERGKMRVKLICKCIMY